MSLTTMLEAAARGGSVEVEAGWTQGRAIYGGLTGALALSAMKGRIRAHAAEAGSSSEVPPLRSLTVSFVGPAEPGPVEVDAEVIRVGSNVTQCQATVRQAGSVVAVVLGAFGRKRESALIMEADHPAPQLSAPEGIEPFPYLEGLTPEFYRFVELRQVGGQVPFSSAPKGDLSGWVSLREAPEQFAEEHVVALTDAWPPAPLQMLSGFAPASSLTWTIEMIDEVGSDSYTPDTVLAYAATTDVARDGYAHTCAMVWSPSGNLTAISRQSITVFG